MYAQPAHMHFFPLFRPDGRGKRGGEPTNLIIYRRSILRTSHSELDTLMTGSGFSHLLYLIKTYDELQPNIHTFAYLLYTHSEILLRS